MDPHPTKDAPSAPPSYAESVSVTSPRQGPPYPGPPNVYQLPQGPPYPGPPNVHQQQQVPPYPGFNVYQQQQPPQPQPQMIVVQTSIPPLGPHSVQLICPTCKVGVHSDVEEEASTSAYLCCMLLFIIGCGICSCIPCCMDSFKVYKHSCPRCKSFIGSYQQS